MTKKNYFIVVHLQLYAFTPTSPPNSSQTHLPPTLLHPLGFVHVSLIVVPENPSPHYPLPPLFWLLWDCSFFLNFLLLFNYSCVPFLPIPPPHPIIL